METEVKYYHKLVRDGIIDILDNDKNVVAYCATTITSKEEMVFHLHNKLREEVLEYTSNPCIEELGDILTVIKALASIHSNDDINGFAILQNAADRKDREKGTFTKGNLLYYVEEIVND